MARAKDFMVFSIIEGLELGVSLPLNDGYPPSILLFGLKKHNANFSKWREL
jgi:hypothetical protein